MARHRRRRVGLWVGRRTYLSLWRRYTELLAEHRALEADHQDVLEDHESLLYGLEEDGPVVEVPAAGVPSWAREKAAQDVTEEIPVITTVGLDPDKADALVRRAGLLEQPGVPRPENG